MSAPLPSLFRPQKFWVFLFAMKITGKLDPIDDRKACKLNFYREICGNFFLRPPCKGQKFSGPHFCIRSPNKCLWTVPNVRLDCNTLQPHIQKMGNKLKFKKPVKKHLADSTEAGICGICTSVGSFSLYSFYLFVVDYTTRPQPFFFLVVLGPHWK